MDSSEAGVGLPASSPAVKAVGVVVSLLALSGVVIWALKQESPQMPHGGAEIAALIAAVVAYGVATAVRSERWRLLLRRSGAAPPAADCHALVAVGYMGNTVLPARGGDVMRIFFMAPRAGTGKRTVIGTLIAERLLDVVALLGLFGLLAYVLGEGAGVPGSTRLHLVLGVGLGAGVVAAGALVLARRTGRAKQFGAFLAPMLATTKNLRGRFAFGVVGITLLLWLVEATAWWGAAGAAGVRADPLEVLYMLSLASVFVLIPAAPGNLGTLDAAVIFGAHAIGASGADALSFVLLLRFVLFVPITIAGLVLLVGRYGGLRRPAPVTASG
jgi:hypothetical protein